MVQIYFIYYCIFHLPTSYILYQVYYLVLVWSPGLVLMSIMAKHHGTAKKLKNYLQKFILFPVDAKSGTNGIGNQFSHHFFENIKYEIKERTERKKKFFYQNYLLQNCMCNQLIFYTKEVMQFLHFYIPILGIQRKL